MCAIHKKYTNIAQIVYLFSIATLFASDVVIAAIITQVPSCFDVELSTCKNAKQILRRYFSLYFCRLPLFFLVKCLFAKIYGA